MKRLLALLLALCLPMTALADTIAERIGAPETWQGEFQTNTGKTHVYVDMTIELPDADALPVYAVEPHTFTIEDVARFADVMLGEGAWYQVEAVFHVAEPMEGEPRYLFKENELGYRSYDCDFESDRAYVSGGYDTREEMGDWLASNRLYYSEAFRSHTSHDLPPLEEAIALADSYVQQFAPGMIFESVDTALDNRGLGHRSDGEYGYRLYYAREVGGTLVTPVHQSGAREVTVYHPVLPYESLCVDVGADGIFMIEWEHPIGVTGVIAKECELLPFENILDIFGTIAPLTIQRSEYEPNNNLYINRAVLGYMCVPERDHSFAYRLVPVWDFFGERTIGRERYDTHNWSYLTINALDGTIIDRELGY